MERWGTEDGVRSTDYGKPAGGLVGLSMEYRGLKSANQSTEYRVQRTEEPGHKKVGTWLRRVLVCIGGQGEALPLPEADPLSIR